MKIKKVYLGQRQIYPEVTHYAYYPLTTDAKDYGWMSRDIVTSWASSYGSDGAVLPDSNHAGLLMPFNIDYSKKWTISFYVRWIINWSSHTSDDARIVDLYYTNNRVDCRIMNKNARDNVRKYRVMKNNSGIYTDSTTYTDNTWMYICLTINNWTVKVYRNWTQNASTTASWTTTYFRFWQEYNAGADRHLYGNIKEIIIEDTVWTAQQITDYFNSTKWDYWL